MGTDDIHKKKKQKAYKDRNVATIPVKPRILIMCEGEKTEPNYFKSFRLPSVHVKPAYGGDALYVVEKAIEFASKAEEPYDQVWCVFDRDIHLEKPQPERFNKAIWIIENINELEVYNESKNLKKVNRFAYAYSNDAFELWYILHFDYMHSAKTRQEYGDMLTERIKKKYFKNSIDMYDDLLDRQSSAISYAEKLLCEYSKSNPERDNPSTTVHILVQELNKYID